MSTFQTALVVPVLVLVLQLGVFLPSGLKTVCMLPSGLQLGVQIVDRTVGGEYNLDRSFWITRYDTTKVVRGKVDFGILL